MNAPILAATDFSPAADGALRWAAALAQQQGCELHAVYVNKTLPPMGDAGMPDSTALIAFRGIIEEQQRVAQEGFAERETSLLRDHPGLPCRFHYRDATGLSEALGELAEELNPLLVVLGTHSRSDLAETVDSGGLDMLRHSRMPTIMIPEGTAATPPKRAALAWDGSSLEASQEEALVKLLEALGCSIDAVHVQADSGTEPDASLINALPVQVHTVQAEDINEGLERFTREGAYDLLIVLPHHHSFWERFFFKLHTPGIISRLSLPVCCLPEVE